MQDRIVPANMEGERYRGDQARFFGEEAEVRSTGSAFMANQAVFFGGDKPKGGVKIQAAAQTQTGAQVNQKSGLYKRDAAAFYGDDKFEVESQGT